MILHPPALNNNLAGYSFGETADGQPGYRKPGADTVIPFKSIRYIEIDLHAFCSARLEGEVKYQGGIDNVSGTIFSKIEVIEGTVISDLGTITAGSTMEIPETTETTYFHVGKTSWIAPGKQSAKIKLHIR